MTLDTQQLMPPLSGNLSGILGPGDFDVEDTIRVAAGDSLRILPGTRLYFRDDVPFKVEGSIAARGTEQDSILFTRRVGSWSGIRLDSAQSEFEYCVIERAADGYWGGYLGGGAFTATSGSLDMSHCAVRYNTSYYDGAGVYSGGGTLTLTECEFFGNGGGYNYYGSAVSGSGPTVTITACSFDSNRSGICVGGANTHVSRCTFRRSYHGYALSCFNGIYDECLIEQPAGWTAVVCGGTAEVRRCTIRGRISCSDSCRVNSSIIAFSADYGAYFNSASGPRVEYCCIYGNASGNFSGNTPPGIGVVALTNANGDSCDTYYNIFLDPSFVDVAAGDYHLTASSPCIDAGDPGLPHDPDGTVADMGAFYFDQLPVMEGGHNILCPYQLAQNYPNPFNARTRISFSLARAGEVSLNVFDITGRLVRTLADGRMAAGTHEVSLDARDLPSGVYVYRLAAGNAVEAKKMVIIK